MRALAWRRPWWRRAWLFPALLQCLAGAGVLRSPNGVAALPVPAQAHTRGRCAMYGVCGSRADGDALNCLNNFEAPDADDSAAEILQNLCPRLWEESGGKVCCDGKQAETMQRQLQMATPIIFGCPACLANFRNLFCTLFCSPDQASFTRITETQLPARPANSSTPVVKEVEFYLAEEFKNATYNSCKDVAYGPANSRAMRFIGNGATDAQEFLKFIGTVKDDTGLLVGSPIQMDFPSTAPGAPVPDTLQPWTENLPACWDDSFKCACGDCPDGPSCAAPLPPSPKDDADVLFHIFGAAVLKQDILIWALAAAVLLVIGKLYSAGNMDAPSRESSLLHPRGPLDAATGVSLAHSSFRARVAMTTMQGATPAASSASLQAEEPAYIEELQLPRVQASLKPLFRQIGVSVTTCPHLTLLLTIVSCSMCILGLLNLHIESDPLKLWVPPTSRAAREKAAYDAAFGPFYRIEQLVLSTHPHADGTLPPILREQYLETVFDVHDMLDSVVAETYAPGNTTRSIRLQDICFKPFGDVCAIESVAQYWQLDRRKYAGFGGPTIQSCLEHWSSSCRSTFKAPMDPKLVLGGYPLNSTNYYEDTTALLITLPVDADPALHSDALLWEREFIHKVENVIMPHVRSKNLSLSFSAESSVQRELDRESSVDASTVALSYLAMFVYISIALSSKPLLRPDGAPTAAWWRTALVRSRTTLSLAGIAIVLASVLSALGLCSALGIPATLIIMEVIPFLVLAIGVDNMFIIASLEAESPQAAGAVLDGRQAPEEAFPADTTSADRVVAALEAAGPSIALASSTEVLTFLIAATTQMPAVRNFAIVAAVAVALNFVLQVTAFPVLLLFDTDRVRAGRGDCFPCGPPLIDPIRAEELVQYEVRYEVDRDSVDDEGANGEATRQQEESTAAPLLPQSRSESGGRKSGARSWVAWGLRLLFDEVVSVPRGRAVVLSLAVVATAASFSGLLRLDIGLDQAVALPRDSYLQQYYKDVMAYARVGPPVLFVVDSLDITEGSPGLDAVCGSASCLDDSLVNQIAAAALQPGESYLATPAASWIDDFFAWLQPELPSCCRVVTAGPDEGAICQPPDNYICPLCKDSSTCLQAADLTDGRPRTQARKRLLQPFLDTEPTSCCPKCGKGVYNTALRVDGGNGTVAGLEDGYVTSSFRVLSAPLGKQRDFIDALAATRALVKNATAVMEAQYEDSDRLAPHVYAYSIFHPFFEQYLTIRPDAFTMLSVACAVVFGFTLLFTGSFLLSLLLVLCLVSMLLNLGGLLAPLGVQLNAVSLVNLAMSAGIGLEFLVHVGHAFLVATGTRETRVKEALVDRGAAVCSGILLTKLVGVCMLGFAQTQIFQVYYFRMYFALIVVGAWHGLVLLPVLLALVGPEQLSVRRRSGEQPAELQLRRAPSRPHVVFTQVNNGDAEVETDKLP